MLLQGLIYKTTTKLYILNRLSKFYNEFFTKSFNSCLPFFRNFKLNYKLLSAFLGFLNLLPGNILPSSYQYGINDFYVSFE